MYYDWINYSVRDLIQVNTQKKNYSLISLNSESTFDGKKRIATSDSLHSSQTLSSVQHRERKQSLGFSTPQQSATTSMYCLDTFAVPKKGKGKYSYEQYAHRDGLMNISTTGGRNLFTILPLLDDSARLVYGIMCRRILVVRGDEKDEMYLSAFFILFFSGI